MYPFGKGFRGALTVASGDVDGDGFADLIVGQVNRPRSAVKVFSGKDGSLLHKFQPRRRAGSRMDLASGDTNGDGRADVIVSLSGPKGPAKLAIFPGTGGTAAARFQTLARPRKGTYVAAGDTDGDGRAEIFVSRGGGVPRVEVFGADGGLRSLINPGTGRSHSGTRIGTADRLSTGRADLLAGAGGGARPLVITIDPRTGKAIDRFLALPAKNRKGLFVSG